MLSLGSTQRAEHACLRSLASTAARAVGGPGGVKAMGLPAELLWPLPGAEATLPCPKCCVLQAPAWTPLLVSPTPPQPRPRCLHFWQPGDGCGVVAVATASVGAVAPSTPLAAVCMPTSCLLPAA